MKCPYTHYTHSDSNTASKDCG